MLMECAATSLERWQWNTHRDTHTHLFFCQKKRRRENKKKQTWLATIIRGMRRRSEWAMTDCWAPSALAAMRCDYAPLATCHMPHAAWLHDYCMPHTACQMCRIATPLPLPIPSPPPPGPPPPAMPMWIGGAVVIWGFRIVVDRLLIFAIVLHAPQKALCIVGATVARGVVYRVIVIVIVVIYAAAAVAADAAWNVQCDYIVNKNALE